MSEPDVVAVSWGERESEVIQNNSQSIQKDPPIKTAAISDFFLILHKNSQQVWTDYWLLLWSEYWAFLSPLWAAHGDYKKGKNSLSFFIRTTYRFLKCPPSQKMITGWRKP